MPTTLPTESPESPSRNLSLSRFWRRLFGMRDAASSSAAAPVGGPLQWDVIDQSLQEAAHRTDSDTRVRARARRLLDAYLRSGPEDRLVFMRRLADGFHVDEVALDAAIAAYQAAATPSEKLKAQAALAQVLESPRMRVLRQFNLLPNGIHSLVQMRAELLRSEHAQALQPLEQDLLRLFTLWFDAGFLELQRIGWNSPASLLEKLIRYEAVHEIKSWNDLRNRLDADRRCYAFFHGRMPGEPLIFVEVALVQALASSVQALLDEGQPTQDPVEATTAIFYSISNAQPGLRGVSMGEFLIKRVVEQLKQEFPKLETFATLSPVPGFTRWLRGRFDDEAFWQQVPADVRLWLDECDAPPVEALQHALAPTPPAPPGEQQADPVPLPPGDELQHWLKAQCAHYLLEVKRHQEPLDPVARFHFGNGASLAQINWLGDSSPNGLRQSLGLMVNYLYELGSIDEHYQAYSREGLLAASPAVQRLLAADEQAKATPGKAKR